MSANWRRPALRVVLVNKCIYPRDLEGSQDLGGGKRKRIQVENVE